VFPGLVQLSQVTHFPEAALDRAAVYARFLYLALTGHRLEERAAGDLVHHAARMAFSHRTDLTDAVHVEVQRLIARERLRARESDAAEVVSPWPPRLPATGPADESAS
jgi:hypothetical protein